MRPRPGNFSRVIILVSLSIVLALMWRAFALGVGYHSLWLDEWLTLGSLRRSWPDLLYFYSSPADTPFPLYFVLIKPWHDFAMASGLPVNWVARSGTLALIAATLLAWAGAAALNVHRQLVVYVFVLGLAFLAFDPQFLQHTIEARWYALMALVAVVIVSLAQSTPLWAVIFSIFLLLLHPFGAMVGVPVGLLSLGVMFVLRGPGRAGLMRCTLLSALFLLALLAFAYLVYGKFISRSIHGSGVEEGARGLVYLAEQIDMAGFSLALLTLFAAFVFLYFKKKLMSLPDDVSFIDKQGLLSLPVLIIWGGFPLGVGAFALLAHFIPMSSPPMDGMSNGLIHLSG